MKAAARVLLWFLLFVLSAAAGALDLVVLVLVLAVGLAHTAVDAIELWADRLARR